MWHGSEVCNMNFRHVFKLTDNYSKISEDIAFPKNQLCLFLQDIKSLFSNSAVRIPTCDAYIEHLNMSSTSLECVLDKIQSTFPPNVLLFGLLILVFTRGVRSVSSAPPICRVRINHLPCTRTCSPMEIVFRFGKFKVKD